MFVSLAANEMIRLIVTVVGRKPNVQLS
jgi:hypothetical protein